MRKKIRMVLIVALLEILRKLTRILLRNGIAYPEFAEYARRAYVTTAWEDFSLSNRKPTVTRVAVITGLTRKEVKRLMDTPVEESLGGQQRYNRAVRVITGWLRDDEFHTVDGNPRPLVVDDENSGFPALVRRYSGDMTARAMLDELERVGTVRIKDGVALLLRRSYTPRGDDGQMLHILGTDVSDLLDTIDHNLQHPDRSFYQQKLSYDNVPREALEQWRVLASAQSQGLLETLDKVLSKHDRDVNPRVQGSGRVRTGVGIFYFEEPYTESINEEKS